MKSRILRAVWMLSVMTAVFFVAVFPSAASTNHAQDLNAENIAERSLSVAETMRSSGYCYAGVSKALSPLGVSLKGSAAYQAREQLLADSRFIPFALNDNVELQRGDIIVFNRSSSHSYGHICVYQGNFEESSDHVSQLTASAAYGGATVFRLRSENIEIADGKGDTKNGGSLREAANLVRRQLRVLNNSAEGRSLTRRLVRFVMRNL